MKKIALVIAVVMILTTLFTLSTGADLRNVQNGKQQKIGSVKVSKDYAPTVNGEVIAGEYPVSYRYTAESTDINIVNGCPTGYVEAYFAHTDEVLYMAFIVQEDEYSYREASSYSRMWIEMGFRFEDSMDAAMTKFGNTLSIYKDKDDDNNEFAGLGFYEYAESSMGSQTPTKWSWLNKGWDERCFKRAVDKDGKNITVYEYSLQYAAIQEAFGLESMVDTFYIRWAALANTADGVGLGNYSFGWFPSEAEKLDYMIAYGWSGSTLPHIFGLYDTKAEMDSDIADFNASSTPDTEPPVTEPVTEPVTDPATDPTTDPVTDPTTDPTTDPATDPATEPTTTPQATQPQATQPQTTEPAGGCGSMNIAAVAAIAVVALGSALVVFKKK